MRYLTTLSVLVALCFPVAVDSAHAQGNRRGKAAQKAKKSAKKSANKPAKRSANKPARRSAGKASKGDEKPQRFVFTGMDLEGQMRTPQLLYFLDRADEELERASLERRSFLPEMVRSIDEEAL